MARDGDNRGGTHVDLNRKLLLRKRFLDQLETEGPVFVAWPRDGQVPAASYPDRDVVVPDGDPEAFAGHDGPPFAAGDFDSDGYPYAALLAWLRNADLADRLVLSATDAQLAAARGSRRTRFRMPDGTFVALDTISEATAVRSGYWSTIVRPWLNRTCDELGWRLLDYGHFQRDAGEVTYWSALLERDVAADRSPRAERPPTKGTVRRRKWSADVERELLDSVRAGLSIEEAAPRAGVSTSTVQRRARAAPDGFGADLERAKAERGATVGQQHRVDPEQIAKYLDALAEGKRPLEAAKAAKVHPATMRRRRKLDAEFDDACREAEAHADERVEASLFTLANGAGDRAPNLGAIVFWLTNRKPDAWRDRRNLGIHGVGGEPPVAVESVADEDVLAKLLQTDEGADAIETFAQVLAPAVAEAEQESAG